MTKFHLNIHLNMISVIQRTSNLPVCLDRQHFRFAKKKKRKRTLSFSVYTLCTIQCIHFAQNATDRKLKYIVLRATAAYDELADEVCRQRWADQIEKDSRKESKQQSRKRSTKFRAKELANRLDQIEREKRKIDRFKQLSHHFVRCGASSSTAVFKCESQTERENRQRTFIAHLSDPKRLSKVLKNGVADIFLPALAGRFALGAFGTDSFAMQRLHSAHKLFQTRFRTDKERKSEWETVKNWFR